MESCGNPDEMKKILDKFDESIIALLDQFQDEDNSKSSILPQLSGKNELLKENMDCFSSGLSAPVPPEGFMSAFGSSCPDNRALIRDTVFSQWQIRMMELVGEASNSTSSPSQIGGKILLSEIVQGLEYLSVEDGSDDENFSNDETDMEDIPDEIIRERKKSLPFKSCPEAESKAYGGDSESCDTQKGKKKYD